MIFFWKTLCPVLLVLETSSFSRSLPPRLEPGLIPWPPFSASQALVSFCSATAHGCHTDFLKAQDPHLHPDSIAWIGIRSPSESGGLPAGGTSFCLGMAPAQGPSSYRWSSCASDWIPEMAHRIPSFSWNVQSIRNASLKALALGWSLWLEHSSMCSPLGSVLFIIQMSAQIAFLLSHLPWWTGLSDRRAFCLLGSLQNSQH